MTLKSSDVETELEPDTDMNSICQFIHFICIKVTLLDMKENSKIFTSEVPDFVSVDECTYHIAKAKEVGMSPSHATLTSIRNPNFSLLDMNDDKILTTEEVRIFS